MQTLPVIKPFSESSAQNKQVILEAIQPYLNNLCSVLEVASGTGQHAVHFAQAMPNLCWQPSDLLENLTGIQQWIEESKRNRQHDHQLNLPASNKHFNIKSAIELNVSSSSWPPTTFDAVFSANSFHIMSKQNVTDFFAKVGQHINPNGLILIYGPFNYKGAFTSESNAHFHDFLTSRDPLSGIKDIEWCDCLATKAGFKLINDINMPHNNRILCWQQHLEEG